MKAEIFLKADAELAEGILYNENDNSLIWVDIEGRKVHKTDFKTCKDEAWDTPSRVGAAFLTHDNEIYAALEDGVYHLEQSGPQEERYKLYCKLPEVKGVRTNDGKCDSKGRIWLGTMEIAQNEPRAAFYKIEDRRYKQMLSQIRISNGLCFSPDNKYLYYVDTPSGYVWCFDYNPEEGKIENRRGVIDYRERQGSFDGMTIDREGQLWAAEWGGSKVSAWDPSSGKQTAEIKIPAYCVSCCSFGGDDYGDLLITTAKSDGYKDSGSIFICNDTGARGVPIDRFKP